MVRAGSSLDAVAFAEGLVAERIFVALESDGGHVFPPKNVFAGEILVEKSADIESLVLRAKDAAESGLRTAIIGRAQALLSRRHVLRALASSRLGLVVHVLADAAAMRGAVYALLDLGVGILFSSGPQNSFDLSLIARRAAEDAGLPFLVVHEHGPLSTYEALATADEISLAHYVGDPRVRLVKVSDPSHPISVSATERAFGRRAGFALSAAMRELEAASGRRHDVIERSSAEGDVMLIGLGVVGDIAFGVAERTRGTKHPVSALKITALRPLDAPRIVKALARAHGATVIEAGFDPLTDTMPLARELKAGFSDAMTWAPGFPGVGRMPRFASAVVGAGGLSEEDLASAIASMRDGDAAPRSYVFGEEGAPRAGAIDIAPRSPRVRVRAADEASAQLLARCILSAIAAAVGLRSRATLGRSDDGVICVDVSASREIARAEPKSSTFDWILDEKEDIATAAALAAAFIAHAHRAAVDAPGIARAISVASGNPGDEGRARAAVESGRHRLRAE